MSKQPLIDEEGEVQELTTEDFAAMRPAAEVVPDVVAAYTRSRGRPRKATRKVSTTIRFDQEILTYFQSSGQGWQTRINEALAEYVVAHPQEN